MLENIIIKIREEGISEEQRTEISSLASNVSKETRNEICPALFKVILNSDISMKDDLGRVIFYLLKNNKIKTTFGLQKLIDALLIIAPEELFKILKNSCNEAKILSKNIKKMI